MPRIQQYESHVEGPGVNNLPQQSINAINPEAHGLEKLGSDLINAGDAIDKRQSQDEVSDLSVQYAQAHADLKNQLLDQAQKGTLDTEKFNDDASDQLDQIGANTQTGAGRRFAQQQSAQIGAHLLESSISAESDLAGAKAKAKYVQTLNANGVSVYNDPSSMEAVMQQQNNAVDALVATGGLPAADAERLRVDGKSHLAMSSFKGLVDLNPEIAKKQLDSGKWDTYINGDQKDEMYGQVSQAERASAAAQELQDRQQKRALEAKNEVSKNGFLKKIQEGTLQSKDILNSSLLEHEKEHFINMMREEAQEKGKTDPTVYNNLWQRTMLPDGDPNKITDQSQLYGAVGNGITVKDVSTLNEWLSGTKTPEGQANQELRKRVMLAADQALVKKDPLGLPADPEGQVQMAKFQILVQQKEADQRKANKPMSDLYNPNSKDFVGNLIEQFRKSQQQIMQEQIGRMNTIQPNGTSTQIGGPATAPQVPEDQKRKPGETIEAWRARTQK